MAPHRLNQLEQLSYDIKMAKRKQDRCRDRVFDLETELSLAKAKRANAEARHQALLDEVERLIKKVP